MATKRVNLKSAGRMALLLSALSLAAATLPARAADEIYRCEAQNGALIFQDKPCKDVPGTRESRSGNAGIRMHVAPPPAEEGAVAQERYRRYLEQVDKDRREQAAADNAAAARLRAEAAASAAAAERAAPPRVERPDICADPYVAETDSRCRGDGSHSYAVVYPVYVPVPVQAPQRPTGRQPPVSNPRNSRPPPREPRNTRAEILDTQR